MFLFEFLDGVASFYKTIMFENDLAFQISTSFVSVKTTYMKFPK